MDNLKPGHVALSSSVIGSVAYIAEDLGSEWELLWFDRSGKQTGAVGRPEAGEVLQPRLSPDGRTVAVSRTVNGNRDIWLIETARGLFGRFTSDPAREGQPIWSRDGRFVLYADQNPTSRRDLWVLPLDGDRKPFAFAQTEFEESDARFSPDGRWIAYQSNETGRNEIYVQPFPGPGGKVRISTGGGTNPQWRDDGRELFYRAAAQLMAVPITITGPRLEAGTPATLFSLAQRAINSTQAAAYTTSDGQRFLITTPTDASIAPLTVILNWHPQGD